MKTGEAVVMNVKREDANAKRAEGVDDGKEEVAKVI